MESPNFASPSFELLQTKRREIYRRVAAMSLEQQVHRPRPDGWSPLEVLEHLNIHDRWVTGAPSIRKGATSRSPFLWLATRLSRTGVSIPTAPFLVPKGGLTLPQLAATSDEQHTALATLVANAHGGETIVSVFPFGALGAEQLCAGLDAHYDYHLRRIGH